jgi:hypothetical protein
MANDPAEPPLKATEVLSGDSDWWEVFQQSLPTLVGPEHLLGLNIGLRHLWAALYKAHSEFRTGKHLDGAYLSLLAVIEFLALFDPTRTDGLSIPLNALESALAALDEGIIEPILRPVRPPQAGRVREPTLRQEFLGMAVYTVRRLCDFGYSVGQAQRVVADDLKQIGVKPARGGGAISQRIIKLWCEKISEDVGCRGTPAWRFHALMVDERNKALDKMPPGDAITFLRGRLRVSAMAFGQIST